MTRRFQLTVKDWLPNDGSMLPDILGTLYVEMPPGIIIGPLTLHQEYIKADDMPVHWVEGLAVYRGAPLDDDGLIPFSSVDLTDAFEAEALEALRAFLARQE